MSLSSSSSASSTVRRNAQAALASSSRLASERRVDHLQPSAGDGEEVDKYGKTSAGQLTALMHTAAWCSAAVLVTWYADLIPTVLYSQHVHRPSLYVGAAAFVALLSILVYMAAVMPRMHGGAIEQYYDIAPHIVHTALACCLLSFFAFLLALWPVYHLWTPLILAVLSMAAVLAPNALPSFG